MNVSLLSTVDVILNDDNLNKMIKSMIEKIFPRQCIGDFKIEEGVLKLRIPVESSYNYHNNYYSEYKWIDVASELQKYGYLIEYLKLTL